MKNKKYFTFCGTFTIPANSETLEEKFPMKCVQAFGGVDSDGEEFYRRIPTGFREGLKYQPIARDNSVTAHLAVISPRVGHLVVNCSLVGWNQESFVVLRDGKPPKATKFDPIPVIME